MTLVMRGKGETLGIDFTKQHFSGSSEQAEGSKYSGSG